MSYPQPSHRRSSHAPTSGLALARRLKSEVKTILRGQAVFRIVGDLQDRLGFEHATEWLSTPRNELDNRSPLEAILAGEEKLVEEIVERLRPVMSPL